MKFLEAYYYKLPINKLLLLLLDNRANGNSANTQNYNLLLTHINKRKPNDNQLNLLDLILEEDSRNLFLHFELFEQKIKKIKPW